MVGSLHVGACACAELDQPEPETFLDSALDQLMSRQANQLGFLTSNSLLTLVLLQAGGAQAAGIGSPGQVTSPTQMPSVDKHSSEGERQWQLQLGCIDSDMPECCTHSLLAYWGVRRPVNSPHVLVHVHLKHSGLDFSSVAQ